MKSMLVPGKVICMLSKALLHRLKAPGRWFVITSKTPVVNKSETPAPVHPLLIDLTNQTSLKETFSIITRAESCILCSSSLACFATKLFPKNRIWIKGGHQYIFTDWATYFYHGPFNNPADITFKDFKILESYGLPKSNQASMLDQGLLTLL